MNSVGSGRLESCWSCRRPVFLAERLVAGGKLRHRTCFTCKRCGHQLNLVGCYETEDGDFVCETCPDEEKREEVDSRSELSKGEGDRPAVADVKDDYALDSIVQSRQDGPKSKFLQDLVDAEEVNWSTTMSNGASDPVDVSLRDERSGEKLPPDTVSDNQHSTASIENLNVKIKNLLGQDFSDTLSLLNKEPDSFIADISEIIDNIINDAVKKAESSVEESLSNKLGFPSEGEKEKEEEEGSVEVQLNDATTVNTVDSDISDKRTEEGVSAEDGRVDEKEEETPGKPDEEVADVEADDYPRHLNPFTAEEEKEEEPAKPPVTPRRGPVPAARSKATRPPAFNQSGQKIIEAPVVNLNPFWSDGEEPSSDEDVTKPVPAPRNSLRGSEQDSPFSRSEYGSFTSLSSIGSSASALRRKKGPAPLPPSGTKSLQYPSSPESSLFPYGYRSPSPTPTIRSHRKSKPAPPPPPAGSEISELLTEKKEKNYENKMRQNLSAPDKSSYGKWKRKKGQAPGLPIPQRRRITPLPLPEFYRELEDLEIQQRELERQGVTIEQAIRTHEAEADEGGDVVGKDVEGLILQLFEIVNQKNELFRRQAELMYLRRQQRLEEEHADLEYQIRCLMGRPERNKTDSDKAQEEELIRRLVEVVERRNEIIECLDMDRKREVEEDESIHHHLEAFAGKKGMVEEMEKPVPKGSPSLLKYIKKKKSSKKEKTKEPIPKIRRDADKDVDEASKEGEGVKTLKIKKKWFAKP